MTETSHPGPPTLPTEEEATLREYSSDGLIDLYIAGLWLTFGIEEMLAHEVGIFVPAAVATLIVAFVLAKRYVTQPRVGKPPTRVRVRRWAAIGAFAIGALALMLAGIYAVSQGWVDPIDQAVSSGIIVGASVFIAFGALALALGQRQFWIYALLFGVPLPVVIALHVQGAVSLPPIVAFGIGPVVAGVVGVLRLMRFLKDHPAQGRPAGLRGIHAH
ncbi:MAG: hypothetical protein OEV43_05490 [Coriobacteriia bacterium]|nr:hypothetical protein [Coriobacteriia bacterium]